MKRALPWITALLSTLYIILVMWSDRTGASVDQLPDLIGSVALAAITVGAGWFASRYMTADPVRRGIIALIFGMWAPLSATMQFILRSAVHAVFGSMIWSTVVWTLVCALLVALVARSKTDLGFTMRMLAFASVFLVLTQTIRVIRKQMTESVSHTPAGRPAPLAIDTLPDVYVLVLDKYTSGHRLKLTYGVDQGQFEDSLRALGFVVPRRARANYAYTHLAIASLLNWRYLDLETDADGGPPFGRTLEMIAGARTWREFRTKGYRIFTFPTWYDVAMGVVTDADVHLRYQGAARPRSRAGETWWINSPFVAMLGRGCWLPGCKLKSLSPYPIETLEEIDWKLNSFASLLDSAGPVFAYLHLLVPHEPYLFDSDCKPVEPWWPPTEQGAHYDAVGKAYGTQVRCFTPRILRTVRTIIARSAVPPVIIIQGDHGHGRIFTNLLRGTTLTTDEVTRGQVSERLSVFAAYRFPGADSLVTNDITPVNVFPLIATSLWGQPHKPWPNRSFWSAYQDSFEFTEVSAEPDATRATMSVTADQR